jgi:hypothetical protein
MRMPITCQFVTLLKSEGLDLLPVLKVRAGELGKRFLFFTRLDHGAHFNQDIVDFALFLFRGTGSERWSLRRTVGGKCTKLQQDALSRIDLAELFDMVSTPTRERERLVPGNEIVAIALFDLPREENGTLGVAGFKDDCDVDVTDSIIVVLRLGSEFNAPNK